MLASLSAWTVPAAQRRQRSASGSKHGAESVVCPSSRAHVKFEWGVRRRPAAELREVVPRITVGRMGVRHPLSAISREGGANWRREKRKEVGGAGVVKGDVACGMVARVPGSSMQQTACQAKRSGATVEQRRMRRLTWLSSGGEDQWRARTGLGWKERNVRVGLEARAVGAVELHLSCRKLSLIPVRLVYKC
jgi:hypothetical protein